MQVIDDRCRPDGTTEFEFSDGTFSYAKQQTNVSGSPWLKLGEWEEGKMNAVESWSGCGFI